jgi:hypothetical protein
MSDLAAKDEALLRRQVYAYSYTTGTITRDGLPRTILVVPAGIEQLFDKNPIGTLKCLLSIAKGGRPSDSRNACAIGFGLGRREIPGAAFNTDLEKFDEPGKATGESMRQRWVRLLERRLAEEQKK